MDADETRKKERRRQMQDHKNDIIEAAIKEFLEKSIDGATIADIAKRAKVGEATVYRYFETKVNLVVESAVALWNRETDKIIPPLRLENQKAKDGYQKLETVFREFANLYMNHPELLNLLEQFEFFIAREKVTADLVSSFTDGVEKINGEIFGMIHSGQRDGSIRPDIDAREYYLTASHTLISLCQKLYLRGKYYDNQFGVNAIRQIDYLIGMQLYFAKSR